MTDVSAVFDHYRISARGLWNSAFWPDTDFRNWDSVDQFDEIQRALFGQLVLGKLGKEWPVNDIFRNPIPFFTVVPANGSAPIMIQNPRPDKPFGYWDHPVKHFASGEGDMSFLRYFDWNRLDYADFRYYLVCIARFDNRAELVGRQALIERQHASVHLLNG
jgi:hypothetical protein